MVKYMKLSIFFKPNYLLPSRATGNSRSQTGKLPRPVPKFPKIPVSKIIPKQATYELSEV